MLLFCIISTGFMVLNINTEFYAYLLLLLPRLQMLLATKKGDGGVQNGFPFKVTKFLLHEQTGAVIKKTTLLKRGLGN